MQAGSRMSYRQHGINRNQRRESTCKVLTGGGAMTSTMGFSPSWREAAPDSKTARRHTRNWPRSSQQLLRRGHQDSRMRVVTVGESGPLRDAKDMICRTETVARTAMVHTTKRSRKPCDLFATLADSVSFSHARAGTACPGLFRSVLSILKYWRNALLAPLGASWPECPAGWTSLKILPQRDLL